MNWDSLIILFLTVPENKGHQVVKPTIIVKTAPILNT